MKKFFGMLVCLIAIVSSQVAANATSGGDFTKDFAYNLGICSKYVESYEVTAFNRLILVKKQIFGWKDGKCGYKEIFGPEGNQQTMTCNFTRAQVNQFNRSMIIPRQYKYSRNKADGLIVNSPTPKAISLWNEYVNDTDICK